MIKKLEISNYKKFDSDTFIFEKNNLLIGDNDSGKSSILEALELFFNKNEISSDLVIDINKDIVITIMLENDEQEYTKIFKMSGKTKAICKEFNYKNLPRYVYIRSNDLEIDKKVSEILSINFVNQLSNETKDNIQVAFKDSIQLFFNSINDNLNVVNGFDKTKLDISETLNYEKLVSFKINDDKTNIVPLRGRGSGFIKNLLYSILINNTMNEFIIGIDEIENSFSLKNVENLIETLSKTYKQTIISTHISSVYEITNNLNYKTIPLHSEEGDINLFKLFDSISHKKEINILLLEGKWDVKWFEKGLKLLEKDKTYKCINAGGSGKLKSFKEDILKINPQNRIITIGDGDQKNTNTSDVTLKKDIIEMYIPINEFNKYFSNIAKIDNKEFNSKEEMESHFKNKNVDFKDYKKKISNWASTSLSIESEFVKELEQILKKIEFDNL